MNTDLCTESRNGNIDEVASLLRNGANPNQKNKHGHTPLLVAIKFNHGDVVQMLLENGAEPNFKSNAEFKTSPLGLACSEGHNGLCLYF